MTINGKTYVELMRETEDGSRRREINSKIEHRVTTFVFAWCATPQSEDRYVAQTALANEIRKTLNLAELDRFIRILKA